jgi:hypothetical protein
MVEDEKAATPGFPDGTWPTECRRSGTWPTWSVTPGTSQLEGFTYSVLDGDEVIGCVSLSPSSDDAHDVEAQSWVRATRAELDVVLWETEASWVAEAWPFRSPSDRESCPGSQPSGSGPVTIGLPGSAAHSWSEAVYTATSGWPIRVRANAVADAAMPPPQ